MGKGERGREGGKEGEGGVRSKLGICWTMSFRNIFQMMSFRISGNFVLMISLDFKQCILLFRTENV